MHYSGEDSKKVDDKKFEMSMFNVRLKGISYCIHVMSDIVVLVSDCFYTIF